jgi:transcriptional regulator with XRE-family HTH domain
MEIRQLLARNLQRLRQARGLSQEELAHQAGVDRSYVSSLERGIYSATLDMLAKIAGALGVPPQMLLEPDESKLLLDRPLQ